MTLNELISAIKIKHSESGITINPPATVADIHNFENSIGFELPSDFKEFYSICNGFECSEDIFKMITLEDALLNEQGHGADWYHFAEYMIYSDTWSLRIKQDGQYKIFNEGETEIILSSSLHEFLERYLKGNVFAKGGLYEWHEELKPK